MSGLPSMATSYEMACWRFSPSPFRGSASRKHLVALRHALPEAQPFALVADARLEHEARPLRPLIRDLVERLVAREGLAVDAQLNRRDLLRIRPEVELKQAEVAQLGE